MEQRNNFDTINAHIDEEFARTQTIRTHSLWGTVGLCLIYVGIASILFAVAFFIIKRTFYPDTNIIHTKEQIITQITNTLHHDISDTVQKSISESVKSSVKQATEESMSGATTQYLKELEEKSLNTAMKSAEKASETVMNDKMGKVAEDAFKKGYEEAVQNALPKLEKMKEEAVKQKEQEMKEATEQAVKEKEQEMQEELEKALNDAENDFKERAKQSLNEKEQELRDKITEEMTEKENALKEKITKEKEQEFAKRAKELENKKEQELAERVKEIIKEKLKTVTEKDVVSNFKITHQKRMPLPGFKNVVTEWKYKSSEDKEPVEQICYVSTINDLSLNLASIVGGKYREYNEWDKYERLNLDNDFGDRAREGCVFYEQP